MQSNKGIRAGVISFVSTAASARFFYDPQFGMFAVASLTIFTRVTCKIRNTSIAGFTKAQQDRQSSWLCSNDQDKLTPIPEERK